MRSRANPKLLIADEPTTALDVTIQAQVLDLLRGLQRDLGMAVILITHDLGVVAEFAHRALVMYAGRIVEQAPVRQLFKSPRHPYTQGLLASLPTLHRTSPPHERPSTAPCRTRPPCLPVAASCRAARHAVAACSASVPLLTAAGDQHAVACIRHADLVAGADVMTKAPAPLLQVRGLTKVFPVRGHFRTHGQVRAVDSIDFDVNEGETLGIVGESGCGKSTTGRLLLRLIEPTSGSVRFRGDDLATLDGDQLRARRRDMQIIFQDPVGSLNPRMTVGEIIAEPLVIHGIGSGAERTARADELLRKVGLLPVHGRRYPHEFSGGQRQRIGIARALALNPKFIVCDEPVSALDVSIQSQVINLMQDLQKELGLTYLFISHNLAVVRQIADRIAVMYLGRIVEIAKSDALFSDPQHPYSKALLSAVPTHDPDRVRNRILLQGDVPSALSPPSGCHFHPRCPLTEQECREHAPKLSPVSSCHAVACPIVLRR